MEDLKKAIFKELEGSDFLWWVEVVRIFARHNQSEMKLKPKIKLVGNGMMSFPGVLKNDLVDFFENQPAEELPAEELPAEELPAEELPADKPKSKSKSKK